MRRGRSQLAQMVSLVDLRGLPRRYSFPFSASVAPREEGGMVGSRGARLAIMIADCMRRSFSSRWTLERASPIMLYRQSSKIAEI